MCQSWNTFNVIYRGAYFAPLNFGFCKSYASTSSIAFFFLLFSLQYSKPYLDTKEKID